jgi:hypothetical protein
MSTGRSSRNDPLEFPVHFLTAAIGGTFLSVLLVIGIGLALSPFRIRVPDFGPFNPFHA